jgi:hypothetical protein
VSFMIFTASVQNILDTTTYYEKPSGFSTLNPIFNLAFLSSIEFVLL